MRDKRKVTVTFSGFDVVHITTVSRLRRAFRKRSGLWKENFFYNLLNNGRAVDGSTVYEFQLNQTPQ
jgi:hypothetical protein